MNAAPSAPSSSSHPTASSTRAAADAPARPPANIGDRRDPADQRRAGEQPKPRELAIRRLAAQLEPQRLLGAAALLVELRPLELEPRVIAIECFLERRDDDVGQPRFELPGQALQRRLVTGDACRSRLRRAP